MASNNSQKPEFNEKRVYRENHQLHFDAIGKSIGKIVHNSNDAKFKSEVCQLLNVKIGRRKKTVQSEIMKLMKSNYEDNSQLTKRQPKERNMEPRSNDFVSQPGTSGRYKKNVIGGSKQ